MKLELSTIAACYGLLLLAHAGPVGADPDAASGITTPPPVRQLKVGLSWGHHSTSPSSFRMSMGTNRVTADRIAVEGGCAVTVDLSWPTPSQPEREPHSIWQYLLEHGEPGQVSRLKDDPGRQPDAPVLTVEMAEDGTRGFSIGLEQLARQEAMWLPEHDVYLTLADAPVDFASHLAALKDERVLDRVKRAPEATWAEWTNRWEDFGNPVEYEKPWETSWLGTRGHLTGVVAAHGSVYKFAIDRWGNVRPDFASPHKFRFDVRWPEAEWRGQRIVRGLPVIETSLQRAGQRCSLEQFAAPLRDGPPSQRGEIASVLVTRVEISGAAGPVRLGFGLGMDSTNRHPELREVAGRTCVVDRETGELWLMVEPGPGLTVVGEASGSDAGDPRIEFDCVGDLAVGESRTLVLKLPSPVAAAADGVALLAALDYVQARAAAVQYWEDWLARGAQFEVPEPVVNDLVRANLWHALMLPRHRTDENGVARIDLPYSNFAYGQLNADWPINQAVYVDYMVYGLRGYFGVAEEEFAAMYHSQQRPNGRVGGYAEWGVYSPGMLYAVGQNYLLSNDRAAFERLLPASLRAMDWCLGEIAKGREDPDMPGLIVAPLNDLTATPSAWGFPNAYFVAGLEVFARALARHGHPRAAEVAGVAVQMREDVTRAFARASVRSPVVQLADGTWINYVPSDAVTPRRLLDQWYPADVDTGSLHLPRLGAIDPRGWLTTALLNDHEDNLFLEQWGAANEPVYNQQATVYLYRDEPEAAIRAFYSMMACAFSHHQLTPLEHRWAWGQYTMPPSTDGAWFELLRNMLLNELSAPDTLFIGQAVPRAWWEDGQRIVITGAPTYFGPVSCRLSSEVARGRMSAKVGFAGDRRPGVLLVRLRHPQQRPLRAVTVNGREWKDFDPAKEWVRIPGPSEASYTVVGSY